MLPVCQDAGYIRLIMNSSKYALFAILILLNSCVAASGGMATSDRPIAGRKYTNLGPAQTTVSWWSFNLGIIGLPLSDPPIDIARNTLLQEKKGDALINLRYWTDQSVFGFIIIRQRFFLKADVIKFD